MVYFPAVVAYKGTIAAAGAILCYFRNCHTLRRRNWRSN